MAKKITLTTVKKFIRENRSALLISCRSSFDGMTDAVQSTRDASFKAAGPGKFSNDLGVGGAWFVFQSRDSFRAFEDGTHVGIEVSNCCGHFVLAVRKTEAEYETRVRTYEAQGLTRSDAQGVVDAEIIIAQQDAQRAAVADL